MVNRRTRKTTKEAIKVPQQEFSLVRLRIEKPPFRKLKNITVEFAERVTLIAGHNGIGKSTILALIANGSGITDTNVQTYTGKPFTGLLNEIIHIDFENEYLVNKTKGTLSNPHLDYLINENEFTKRCGFTRRLVKNKDGKTSRTEVRVVPRNTKTGNYEDVKSGVVIGSDSKVPIPTIYLGMTRMIPIGESDPELILNSLDNTIDKSDAEFINKFIKDVINIVDDSETATNAITTQSIQGTSKIAKHPEYAHSPKSISLGQDSLSSIATALASFRRLEREWPDYPGGLLVIDEIDAGFHPHAQKSLMDGIKNVAKKLRIQVVATTHSLCMIEAIHPDTNPIDDKGVRVDSVVYITDSIAPRIKKDLSFSQIQGDMSLTPPEPTPKPAAVDNSLKIYLEDAEANFILGHLLTQKLKRQVNTATGKRLKAIPISVGCNNLQGLQKFDKHFKKVLIVVDADASVTAGLKNVVKLPGSRDSSGKGHSPERTIYEFVKELMKDDENYPTARKSLEDMNVTRNQLSTHLLKGDFNIKDRVSAKGWMKARLQRITDWKLVELWLAENPAEVVRFQDDLIAASVATAKLTK
ncbi:hypothetical protein C4J96_3045 [Pseudomonas orientalis]|uniref:AAA family ATPase n=1 Tax=Pseudomonas orientalis TaxID=76758 RepID=UPI000F573B60|nr:AAA family ATPase [Pseudomonas orientalis]AZE95160.1 hypothetical protein C4J96_3045 [Pseudomonas orientalis]